MRDGDPVPTVEVEKLRIELGDSGVDIVDDVSFSIGSGEVLGLVGESGSGKTTVGLSLLGYSRRGARIAGGSIRIDGRDILACSDSELRRLRGSLVSYVPQDPGSALNPALRVREQVCELLEIHAPRMTSRDREERLHHVLVEVGLPVDAGFLHRYPHQLSGGQQQRIALAMAFACNPKVIVLDEPTTGLDVVTQAHVLEAVRRLCSLHGVAALYVSHDLAVVAELATRTAVMYAGRMVEIGRQREIFRESAHPYTRGLQTAIPDISGRYVITGIPGSAPAPGRRPAGCFFVARCRMATEACSHEEPLPLALSATHSVRCHRAREVLAEPISARLTAESAAAAPADAPLLSVQDVVACHDKQEVVHGASFDVAPLQCVALVGESGSGKTTLARCIIGLHERHSGDILLRGAPLASTSGARTRDAQRSIQYVFQNPYKSLNPRRTIGDIIARPLRLFFELDRRELRSRVDEALERVLLSPRHASRYPDQLSGGERQRVAIARAIAPEPALLICDEVTSALDVSIQATVVDLLAELQQQMGLGMLFITHDLALVRSIADHVLVMKHGDIIETGPVEDVLGAPQAEATKVLVAHTPSIDAAPALSERPA